MENNELAPVDTLSDEDFDKAFEQMELNENSESYTEEQSSDNGTEEGELEQPNEATEDTETTHDDELAEEDSEELSEDSSEEEEDDTDKEEPTADEAEESKTVDTFDFNNMPLDETLPFTVKANGQDMNVTVNQLMEGFKKGINYTQNMQQLAPYRKSIGMMEDNNLTETDLNLLIEAKGGSKEALAKLMSNSDIDPLDIELDGSDKYVPKDHGKEVVDLEYKQVTDEIIADKEFGESVQQALNTMPQDFYDKINGNSSGMNNLYGDIKSGIYNKVMPEVIKLQALYGATDTMALYIDTANKMFGEKTIDKSTTSSKVNRDRVNKVKSTTKKKGNKVPLSKKLEDMSDDEFDEEFKKLYGDIGNY